MQVITENAEKQLLQELKRCWENAPSLRCLHIKFSQIKQSSADWFRQVVETIRRSLDDPAATLFFCQDNDVFILTRFMTSKGVDDFFAHLSPKLEPALRATITPGLASLFEIGVDWPKLRTVCENKIENQRINKEHERARRQKRLSQSNRKISLDTISKDLVCSLHRRRAQRSALEIMVVEDDIFSQKLVKNALKDEYPLTMTSDGQGAIMSYVNRAPDILFLDIGLPDINGHEVLEKLFTLDPDAYVVMFSGNGDKENVMKAIELGAKGFIGKPFTQEKLIQYIQKSPFIQEKQNRERADGNLVR